jgi:O-antigen biosynthesis protein
MQVSFIIPLYNCLPLTQAMLASLRGTLPAGLDHEIILVDDGSTDGTREWLQTLPPSDRIILNEQNLGFAATCNRGADDATGEFLVFLNNDLVLLPHWLEPMLTALERQPGFGAVGNLQLRVDNGELDHAGLLVTPQGKIAHAQSLPPGAPRNAVLEVPGVTAACLIIRRTVFLAAGRFDPEFINGGEDVDLGFRLRAQGLKCGVATASVVRHHVSAARGPTNERDERNSRRLAQRWHEELVHWGALTWAREQVAQFIRQPWTRAGRRALAALPFARGWMQQPPRFAWLLLTSALYREQVRWQRLFDRTGGPPRDRGPCQEERFFRDDVDAHSVWLRDRATVRLSPGFPGSSIVLSGFLLAAPPDRPHADRPIGFRIIINGRQTLEFPDLPLGNFNLGSDAPFVLPGEPTRVDLELIGVGWSNFLAAAGRFTQWLPLTTGWRRRLGRYRRQTLNRRLRFVRIVCDDVVVFDFTQDPASRPLA